MSIFNLFRHRHHWETTHTNRWQHPTRQKCKCGVTRSCELKPNADEINGMPWKKHNWVQSDGIIADYSSER